MKRVINRGCYITLLVALTMMQTACGPVLKAKSIVWAPGSTPTHDQSNPLNISSRKDAISRYLNGHQLDPIEGVWVWSNNEYEALITKNNLKGLYSDYDYIGALTDAQGHGWHIGEVKLLLKATASPSLYSGVYVAANRQQIGTTFILSNENLVETTLPVPVGMYSVPEKVMLIRMYPKTDSWPTPTAPLKSGTGFFISPSLVATNYHVVDSGNHISVYFGNTKRMAEVVLRDRQNDLALLKVTPDADPIKAATFNMTPHCFDISSKSRTRAGERVFVLGFPLSGILGSQISVSEGIINSIVGIDNDPRDFQISVPIQPGNSGSPLFNSRGQVIGIVNATLNPQILQGQGDVPQNVNFAIKVTYLQNLISMAVDSECSHPLRAATTPVSAEQIRASYATGIVRIETTK